MKIRIKGDSVRFRLTQSEVKKLSEEGHVFETTTFENATFGYQVKLREGLSTLQVEFSNNNIILFVPKDEGKTWFLNDKVGYENTILLPSRRKLHLLLEKDFTCLDNTLEDQSDNYPNPKLQSQ